MFESTPWLAQHGGLLLTLALASLAGVIYLARRRQINFWLMDRGYVMPLCGKINRLAKDTTQSTRPGWLNAELTLCADYRAYIQLKSRHEFSQCIQYLKKSHDLGRAPMPLWVLLFLVVLVIAEGLGFSYMLGTWMAREGSANTHTVLMIAIVLVLCGIMVWVTHSAGHQFYRTSLLRSCFRSFKDHHGARKEDAPRSLHSGSVALSENQSIDDNQPDYTQIANRVGNGPRDSGSYGWTVIAAVAITVIAVLSTYMRWENLKGELIRDTTMQTQSATPGNPFAGGLALPDAVTAPQQAADAKAAGEVRDATRGEGMAAFVMLGFIFVVTQIVGISAGYKYGFAGKESAAAFRDTGGFATFDAYQSHYEPIIHLAESRLQTLQHRLEEFAHQKLQLVHSFADYLQESQARSVNLRESMATLRPVEPPATAPEPVAANVPPTVEQTLARLDQLPDKQQKLALIDSLAPELAQQVTEQLRQRKAADAERLARQRAELDALL